MSDVYESIVAGLQEAIEDAKLKKKKDRFRNETSDIQVRKDLTKKSEVPTD